MPETQEPKQKNWFARHKVLTVIGVLIILAIIGSNGSKNADTKTASNSTPGASPAASAAKVAQPTPTPTPKVPAEYVSALDQAGTYSSTMHLSKAGIYDQLTSQYGGKFTAPAAQYAIDNVKSDWNANALAQAKTYQSTMHLSPAAVRDQLVSDNGGKFLPAEADYAIAHLND
jgi:hypothetical protein